VRNRPLFLGILLGWVLLVPALAADPALSIASCVPLRPAAGLEPQGLLVTVESTQAHPEPTAQEQEPAEFRVEGRVLSATRRSVILAGKLQISEYLVQPLRTGPQEVEVRLRGRRAVVQVDFQTEGEALLPGRFDGETLLAPEEALPVFSWYLRDLQVKQDGRVLPLRDGKVRPAWHPGVNVLELCGVGPSGEMRCREYRLNLVDPSSVPLGSEMLLPFGQLEGRSGPLYDLRCEGEGLKVEGWAKGLVHLVHKPDWVEAEERYVARVRAVKPGSGRLVYLIQPHFLLDWEVWREVPVQVQAARDR